MRTFTLPALALILLFVAAIFAFPKYKEPAKTQIKTSKLEVKTTSTKVSKPKPFDVKFGLNATFGPKPQTEEN